MRSSVPFIIVSAVLGVGLFKVYTDYKAVRDDLEYVKTENARISYENELFHRQNKRLKKELHKK